MNDEYDIVVTSPENALSAEHLKPYLIRQQSSRSLHIIIDEAHCIKKWGESGFRKAWYEIGLLRAFVRLGVPFAAVSATPSSETLEAVVKSLHFDPRKHVVVNVGNFKPNIVLEVKHLTLGAGSKSIPEINSLLPPFTTATERIPLTLIFVNSRSDGHNIYSYLREFLPPRLRSHVQLFHALLAERTKKWIMHDCMSNRGGIYICTEVAAMVGSLLSPCSLY